MFFYIVKKQDDDLVVTLDHVLKATEEGYELQSFTEWHETHSISELDSYRMTIEQKQAKGHKPEAAPSASVNGTYKTNSKEDIPVNNNTNIAATTVSDYFAKVKSLYPDHVLDKVIVCVGTGGARSFLENCARSGFRNFILMDKDVVGSKVTANPYNISLLSANINHMLEDMHVTAAASTRLCLLGELLRRANIPMNESRLIVNVYNNYMKEEGK